jgi:hypothetical protein
MSIDGEILDAAYVATRNLVLTAEFSARDRQHRVKSGIAYPI